MAIDLHLHTAASDGTDEPAELVALAKQRGLTAIAVTDHDTIDGVGEACRVSDDYGVEVIPGIEISAEFAGQEVHVLGYFIDVHDPGLREMMAQFQSDRTNRVYQMVEKMKRDDLPITFSELRKRYPDAVLGRAHIGTWLIEQGLCQNMEEAFSGYLSRGSVYYVPRNYLTVPQAAERILGAGGLPVLAHPMLYHYNETELRELFALCAEVGFVGAEVYYSTYSEEETKTAAALAEEFGLLATGGSDYHGSRKPNINLGTGEGSLAVSESVLEALKAKRK